MILTEFEPRDTPAVGFRFDYDGSFFTSSVRAIFEQAGRAVGNPLNPPDGTVIAVAVRTGSVGAGLACGSLAAGITIDLAYPYHTGRTQLGLDAYEYDLFSVVSHELLHVLGVGTVPGWAEGARARGVPLSPDGVHLAAVTGSGVGDVVYPGRRYGPTATDFDVLRDLGWNPTAPVLPFLFASVLVGPSVRQYIGIDGAVFEIGRTGGTHYLYADLTYDGVPDLLVAPARAGIGYAIDGRSGALIDASVIAISFVALDHDRVGALVIR